MDTLLDNQDELSGIAVTDEAIRHLDTTRKWGMGIGVFGLVIGGVLALGGIALTIVLATRTAENAEFPIWLFGLLYVLLAALYLAPGLLLVQFCSKTAKALRFQSALDLTEAFRKQKQLYMLLGIQIIAAIVLYGLFVLGAALGALEGLHRF